MLSLNESEDKYSTELEPDPPIQILKLFSESYIAILPSAHQGLRCVI